MLYLAAPYTHPDESVQTLNYLATMQAACYLMVKEKLHVFSPVLHCREMAIVNSLPHDVSFWNDYNREMLSISNGLLVLTLDGWTDSMGVKTEILMAKEYDKSIKLVNPSTYEITPYTEKEIHKQHMRQKLRVVHPEQTSEHQSSDTGCP